MKYSRILDTLNFDVASDDLKNSTALSYCVYTK